MHPLLKSAKQIVMLTVAWLPLIAGVSYVHTILASVKFTDALILLGPVLIIDLFIFLSVWYVCKSTPLETKNISSFFTRHLVTIIVMNAIWLHVAMLYSEFLNMVYKTDVWRAQFDLIFPVLMVIGFFIYFVSAMLSYLFLTIEQARTAEQNALQNQLKASQAELRFLKATIHPHFLFNSLTALATLTRSSAEKAQQVCQQLAEFLRYSLTFNNKEFVSVKEELDHIQNYLGVEKIRLGRRLITDFEIDDSVLDQEIPSFSLQPLIENAIKHGIEPSMDGGSISMSMKKTDDYMYINISNPFSKEIEQKNTTGHGLNNLKSRLKKMYNNDAKILVHKGESAFSVKMYVPFRSNALNESKPTN